MRRRLLIVTLAVTSLLIAAFAIPLGLLVRDVARDRALSDAERDTAALAPVLAVTSDAALLRSAVGRTGSGDDGRMSLWMPDGTQLGDPRPPDPEAFALVRERRVAFSQSGQDGLEVYTPVVVGIDEVSVIRVRVTSAILHSGVARSWMMLAVLALTLLAIAVAATDRLARTVTAPAGDLAATSRALAAGDVRARAQVGGPPEIAAVGRALNVLADRIDGLRMAERERVADLSHRLRTPLTALRLEAETLGEASIIEGVDDVERVVTQIITAARRPLHEALVLRTDVVGVVEERNAFWGALADDDERPYRCVISCRAPVWIGLGEQDAAAMVDALLGNVFAHTPDRTPYEIHVDRSGDLVAVTIDDGGQGVPDPAAVLRRGSSGGGSSGLGLDIARASAESAGGGLRIERSPLGGARVVIELPVLEEVR